MNEKHLSNIKFDKNVDDTALAKLKKQNSKTFNFHWVKSVRIWSFSGPYFHVSLRISTYSVQMREKTDQKNSKYGHFSRRVYISEAYNQRFCTQFSH